jgi:hypothetical protein
MSFFMRGLVLLFIIISCICIYLVDGAKKCENKFSSSCSSECRMKRCKFGICEKHIDGYSCQCYNCD